jgi:hypothetical protein
VLSLICTKYDNNNGKQWSIIKKIKEIEEFADTKGVSRIRKSDYLPLVLPNASKKNRQQNVEKKKVQKDRNMPKEYAWYAISVCLILTILTLMQCNFDYSNFINTNTNDTKQNSSFNQRHDPKN